MSTALARQGQDSSLCIAWSHSEGPGWQLAHQQYRDDPIRWQRLPFQGLFSGPYPGEVFEMRGCPVCGSSVHRPISVGDALLLVARQASIHAAAIDLLAGKVPK